ncbi:uncharacterized protein LOC110737163 [Chenopodium quinoa]|uniref:uncharacterized protein LOC110737163 n=1 Tax=Chenopodium quinoa TaxID=63459 RepID=UPI000B771FB8|nr:uncharacterized protein LOC110737163 [Chenopodium quinoa]
MGFVYHSYETDRDFHPTCVNLENEIKIEDVTFRLEKQGTSSCAWCKRKLVKGAVKKIPGWSNVSEEDHDYNFHVYCVMEMAMQGSSSNEVFGKTMSLTLQGKGNELPIKTKSKKISKSNKWLRILKLFVGTVFSILLGDPTTIIASTMAHLVIVGLFHNTG